MKIDEALPRKESMDKVTGVAGYVADMPANHLLHCRLKTSPHAHARIESINTDKALGMKGVRCVLVGRDVPILCGEEIRDRPILAIDTVRYAGEPVAVVIADTLFEAKAACDAIEITYTALPPVLSPLDATMTGAALVHPLMGNYVKVSDEIRPEIGSNIVNRVRIRKGDTACAFKQCTHSVTLHLSMPPSDHVAMETRVVQAEIHPDGQVLIDSSTQAPHGVKSLISDYFGIASGFVTVTVPLVGGGFGGKSAIQLELIAYAASRAVGGRKVRLQLPREQDFASAPCKEGLEASIRLGAAADGRLLAMEATYHLDCGAYADSIPRVAQAVAVDCSGPYSIPNICCDALCVYTNHPYATAYRGFGHIATTFVIERAMDALAKEMDLDAFTLREINAFKAGDISPTQAKLTKSECGDFSQCLSKLKAWIDWPGSAFVRLDARRVRAIGLGCFIKSPSNKPDATSGAVLTFNADGSLNLHIAVVECGPGVRTALTQVVADALHMAPERIFVSHGFNTHVMPEHWKTVASMSMYLAGNAALRAAQDVMAQLKLTACAALHGAVDEIGIANETAYLLSDPSHSVPFADIIHGYALPGGHVLGAQVIGRGGFTTQRVTPLNADTGMGTPAHVFTVGAQAVEIEVDERDLTYTLKNAWTIIDAGKVINPLLSDGVIKGGMTMGLSLASRENFIFDQQGVLKSHNLRTYKPLHIGQEPRCHVDYVQTPLLTAPYGARPINEHGILGMPAALANALSRALGAPINTLPLVPEALWRFKGGAQ